MQQHHSLSPITHEGKCHLLGTQSLPSTTNISSFNLQNFLLRSANASIFHETFAQTSQGLIANKCLRQKLTFTCAHVQRLRWPESSFGFLVNISRKKQNELFGQPNTMIVPWLFPVFPALETTGDSNNHHIKHNFTLL